MPQLQRIPGSEELGILFWGAELGELQVCLESCESVAPPLAWLQLLRTAVEDNEEEKLEESVLEGGILCLNCRRPFIEHLMGKNGVGPEVPWKAHVHCPTMKATMFRAQVENLLEQGEMDEEELAEQQQAAREHAARLEPIVVPIAEILAPEEVEAVEMTEEELKGLMPL